MGLSRRQVLQTGAAAGFVWTTPALRSVIRPAAFGSPTPQGQTTIDGPYPGSCGAILEQRCDQPCGFVLTITCQPPFAEVCVDAEINNANLLRCVDADEDGNVRYRRGEFLSTCDDIDYTVFSVRVNRGPSIFEEDSRLVCP